jgi:hypothetical protein
MHGHMNVKKSLIIFGVEYSLRIFLLGRFRNKLSRLLEKYAVSSGK